VAQVPLGWSSEIAVPARCQAQLQLVVDREFEVTFLTGPSLAVGRRPQTALQGAVMNPFFLPTATRKILPMPIQSIFHAWLRIRSALVR
jgi:hypothetical protein